MPKQIKENTKAVVSDKKRTDYIFAVGRRREATARVRLYQDIAPEFRWGEIGIQKGEIFVNQMPVASYFSGDVSRRKYAEPLRVINAQNQYTFTVQVEGGGRAGQLNAMILGMARALSLISTDNRKALKDKGFLTRDARVRERRKVGTGGKARRRKQSPKR